MYDVPVELTVSLSPV